jgi:transposase
MIQYHEVLRLHSLGYSQRQIAASVHSSRNKIRDILHVASEKGLHYPFPEPTTDEQLHVFLYPQESLSSPRKIPDCSWIHNELAKPGVTLTLLWSEYCEQAQLEHSIPYQYSYFCELYHSYAQRTKATLRIQRKPGESIEVDWAGKVLTVFDEVTGEGIPAYVFVATLSCSLYSYAVAFPNRCIANWIQAHIQAFQFFSGVARILIPDNLKTAVTKHTTSELILHRSYQEMAEYYNTAVIPARPYSPRGKPNVESAVGVLSTWIIAALRNEKFFSFAALNEAIAVKLKEFNEKPFQKKNGSRLQAFEQEEKAYLQPLPISPYEMAQWQTTTIQPDYLITIKKIKYSVPYEYIGQNVDIRITSSTIEVFYHSHRIASHIRRYGICDMQICKEHMPEKHQKVLSWNRDTFLGWARDVGKSTHIVMESFFASVKVEQQCYKSCAALMKLRDRYSLSRIEDACSRALLYTPSPSFKNIHTILKTGQDKHALNPSVTPTKRSGKYGYTRGAHYFQGGKHATPDHTS